MLTQKSSAKLSECIEVSFQEGKFVLRDVELDPEHCTKQILAPLLGSIDNGSETGDQPQLKLYRCSVDKFEINLGIAGQSGTESAINDDQKQKQRQVSTRFWNIPSSLANISIQAQIDLTGVRLDLGPSYAAASSCNPLEKNHLTTRKTRQTNHAVSSLEDAQQESKVNLDEGIEGDTISANFFSSYVDTALASLRVNLTDVSVTLLHKDPITNNNRASFTFSLTSATYYDMKGTTVTPQQYNSRESSSSSSTDENGVHFAQRQEESSVVVMHKVIDFSGLSATLSDHNRTNDTASNRAMDSPSLPFANSLAEEEKKQNLPRKQPIADTNGCGQIRLRVIQSTSEKRGIGATGKDFRIFHDVDISLLQQWRVTMDARQLILLMNIAQSFVDCICNCDSCADDSSHNIQATNIASSYLLGGGSDNSIEKRQYTAAARRQFSTDIENRYSEARMLAEQKEVVGGILIPICHDESDGASDVYDAFFDCTDRSFSAYLSLVRPPDHSITVKSRMTLHLTELSVTLALTKISGRFSDKQSYDDMATCVALTMGDMTVTGTMFDMESTCNFELSHLELDYTVPIYSSDGKVSREEGSIVRFIEVSRM